MSKGVKLLYLTLFVVSVLALLYRLIEWIVYDRIYKLEVKEIECLTNQKRLAKIVVRYKNQPYHRRAAIDRLDPSLHQPLLAYIAKNDTDREVSEAAIIRLEDVAAYYDLMMDKAKDCSEAAIRKLYEYSQTIENPEEIVSVMIEVMKIGKHIFIADYLIDMYKRYKTNSSIQNAIRSLDGTVIFTEHIRYTTTETVFIDEPTGDDYWYTPIAYYRDDNLKKVEVDRDNYIQHFFKLP
jgi:hypothetical protein